MKSPPLLLVIVLFIEVILGIYALKRWRLLPTPSLVLAYIFFGQIVLWLVNIGALKNDFLLIYTRNGINSCFYQAILFYGVLFLFIFFSHFITKTSKYANHDRPEITSGLNNIPLTQINIAVVTLVLFIYIMFSICVDWSVAWENNQYLLMTSPEGLKSGFRSLAFFSSIFLPFGLMAAAQSAINLSRGLVFMSFVLSMMAMYPSIYLLGAHSRAAALPPAAFLVVLVLTDNKKRILLYTLTSFYIVLAIISGLAGRSASNQGLSTLPHMLGNISSIKLTDLLSDLLTNIFEGVFDVVEGFTIHGEYPVKYKVLSLMPTPSFIDNFELIRDVYQIRLHVYVPLSGYVEVWLFGWQYILALALIFLLSIRIVFSIERLNRTAFYIANFFLFIGFYALNAYPLRNGLKLFWVGDVIALLIFAFSLIYKKDTDQFIDKQSIYNLNTSRPFLAKKLREIHLEQYCRVMRFESSLSSRHFLVTKFYQNRPKKISQPLPNRSQLVRHDVRRPD